jgi:hypothetical protein
MANFAGQIEFFQACLPPLPLGDYSIKVKQTLREIRPKKPFVSKLEFSVAGPRFSLTPTDVYAVYPPANQTGKFENTLPHIVFTRRTLPWERTVMLGKQPDSKNPCPWLALLLLSDADCAREGVEVPEIKPRKIEQLLKPEDANVQGPDLKTTDLKLYESANDLCNTVDLPIKLFAKIVPSEPDLPYLAHARQVHTGNKETMSLQTEGCFAVVLGNRFPEASTAPAGGKNTVYAVSLEGFHNDLYGKTGRLTAEKVRLAVLASWNFFCQGNITFTDSMQTLKVALLSKPPADRQQIKQALELGYAALDHSIRNGEKTVSWYRGPLVPLNYPKRETYSFLPSADAALRYNYETGLMDASYAAAWQLGRLLALQNPHFSRVLYRYRNQNRQKVKRDLRQTDVQQKYGLAGNAAEHVVEVFRRKGDR